MTRRGAVDVPLVVFSTLFLTLSLSAASPSPTTTIQSSTSSCLDPRAFGASPQNGYADNAAAFGRALDAAAQGHGGGCVEVCGGCYLTSSLNVSSNTLLRICQGSSLKTAANVTMPALVYIHNADNVTLEGPGTYYGNAEGYIGGFDPEEDEFEPTLPDGSRPRVILVRNSTNIGIYNAIVRNASDWHIHLQGAHNVVIDGVTVEGDWRFPNNDGIDPDSSTNVTIQNCYINVADDGVCPKATSGYGPLRDLYVHNVTIRSKSHAIKFGSNTDEDMYNIVFDNITIFDSNGGMAIQQRSDGDIFNVTWQNIRVETRYVAPNWWGNGEFLWITSELRKPSYEVGRIYNIRFINITGRSENGAFISGNINGVQDVLLENINITITAFGNYSDGSGPTCLAAAEALNETQVGNIVQPSTNIGPGNIAAKPIPCMGTRDRRPSERDGSACDKVCRAPGKADGFYLENAQNITFRNVHVQFEKGILPARPDWFGVCLDHDGRSSNINRQGLSCSGL